MVHHGLQRPPLRKRLGVEHMGKVLAVHVSHEAAEAHVAGLAQADQSGGHDAEVVIEAEAAACSRTRRSSACGGRNPSSPAEAVRPDPRMTAIGQPTISSALKNWAISILALSALSEPWTRVLAHVHRIELADGALVGVGRVGGAHDFAVARHGVFAFEHLNHDGFGDHEVHQLAEERRSLWTS